MIVVLHVMYAPLLFMGNKFYEWGRCRYQHLYARFCDSYCTHVAFTAMISDLLYKTIKAGKYLLPEYVLQIYLLKIIMEYIITLLNSTYQ